MNNFVIVIEADNKRAHAAYLKGLEDLEIIWPQLMTFALDYDKKQEEKYKEWQEEQEKIDAEHEVAMAEYREKVKAWKSSMFRQSIATFPSLPRRPYSPGNFYIPHAAQLNYESIKRELKRMADLAGAAIGPFRMTENQVAEMIAWEDGSKIESMKTTISRDVFK